MRKLFLFFCSSPTIYWSGFSCNCFLNYKIPYSSYPQEHYLISSLQQQSHTSLQCNSDRHFVIQNTPEIMFPATLHSGVIFCVIMKKHCCKQIEKCNNCFAAHDLHGEYPDSTTALLILTIQVTLTLRPGSISLHPIAPREISKKITYYLSLQKNSSEQPVLDCWYLSDNLPDYTNW